MPIFTIFFSLIIASIVSILLTSLFNENGQNTEWIHNIFLSIIGAGVISSAVTKKNLCKLCSLISIKRYNICQCQHS